MAIQRELIITGPALVTFRGASFWSKGDIEVKLNQETFNIDSSAFGKVDERAKDISADISFEPVGEWEATALAALWNLYPSMIPGASIFGGATDYPLVVWSLDGAKFTFGSAALTKIPDIIGSAEKTLVGNVGFTAIRANNTSWTTANSLFTCVSSGGAAPAVTTFDPTKVITAPFTLAWAVSDGNGDAIANFASFETKDGLNIAFNLATEDIVTDREGLVDKRFKQLDVVAKAVPLGPTEADVLAAMRIQGTGAARGRSLSAGAVNLVATCAAGAGSPIITLNKVALKNSGYHFGASTIRLGELEWIATKATSADTLFTVATQ